MTMTMTCEQFEAQLPDYLEGDLTGDERVAFERHAEACAHCRPILEDLKAIVASAGTLGPIEPSRDLWSGIESRIGTQVVPLGSRRTVPLARGLAAAAVLMAVTAGVTYELAMRNARIGQPTAAATPLASASSDQPTPTGTSGPVIVTTPPQVASSDGDGRATPDATGEVTTRAASATASHRGSEQTVQAVRNGGRVVNTAALYDREISRLHSVIESRRAELDPKTVAAIERSLAVIDTAIAQARSALAADPASRFLHGRLTDALDKKVELLRTTAMLPARS
jgi:anti-sigma factor ChrR (cupin superfamily)